MKLFELDNLKNVSMEAKYTSEWRMGTIEYCHYKPQNNILHNKYYWSTCMEYLELTKNVRSTSIICLTLFFLFQIWISATRILPGIDRLASQAVRPCPIHDAPSGLQFYFFIFYFYACFSPPIPCALTLATFVPWDHRRRCASQ